MNTTFQPVRVCPECQAALDRLGAYLDCLHFEDERLREEVRLQAATRFEIDRSPIKTPGDIVRHGFELVDQWCFHASSNEAGPQPQRRLRWVLDPASFPIAAARLRPIGSGPGSGLSPVPPLQRATMRASHDPEPTGNRATWIRLDRFAPLRSLLALSAVLALLIGSLLVSGY